MERESIKLLLVEDNPGDARLIQEMFRDVDALALQWRHAGQLQQAFRRLEEEDFDLVLLDLGLPDTSGMETFITLHERMPHVPVVVLTGNADEELGSGAVEQGAQDYLVKGQVDTQSLLKTVRYAVFRHRAQQDLLAFNERLEKVVAERTSELTASEEKYRTLVEHNLQGLVVAQGSPPHLVFANRAIGRMLGFTSEELVSLSAQGIRRLIHLDDRDKFFRSYRVSLDGEERAPQFEFRAIHRDGRVLWLDLSANPIEYRGEPAVQATFVDVTERRRAEDALAAEKERLAVTLASIGDGVIATDTTGTIVLINEVAQELTACPEDEVVGSPLSDVYRVIGPDGRIWDRDPVQQVLDADAPVELSGDAVLVDSSGMRRVVAERGSPIRDWEGNVLGAVIVVRDVTERNRWEEERARTQRVESLGVLAGGIAHDFNNLLTAAMGNVNLAQVRSQNPAVTSKLEDAERALEKATLLVRQLAGLTQGGAPQKATVSLAGLIEESARLALSGSNTTYIFAPADDLWRVDVDPVQMSQVVQNIVLNAEQAMPSGGSIVIEAENVVQDESFPLGAGDYVCFSVRDKGLGIPPEHASQIFDPYFTTKQKGSGLGLTVAYTTVKKHGGSIALESALGQGSTLRVHLPASVEVIDLDEDGEVGPVTGTGRVLVMDDEDMVRDVCADILRHLGYDAVGVESGEVAVSRYQEAVAAGEPFDAVIVDLTVPGGMGGGEVLAALREGHPEVKVIASSGYSDDPIIARPGDFGFTGSLTKPYTASRLGVVVRDCVKG